MTPWNPGYYDKWENFIPYEKKWYCNHNKLIHQTEKEMNKCQHCNSNETKNNNMGADTNNVHLVKMDKENKN